MQTSARLQLSVLMLAMLAAGACAGHQVSHTASDESRPHITWEIRAGGAEGHDRLACQSSSSGTPCVLTASGKDRRELATVHLYFHASAQTANYEGTLMLPFLDGASERPRPVAATLQPGAAAEGPTITGLITPTPGTYTMTVALKVKHGDKNSTPITRDVTVVVR